MKDFKPVKKMLTVIALTLVLSISLALCGCDGILNDILSSLETSSPETAAPTPGITPAPDIGQSIPYTSAPVFEVLPLPEEDFSDDLEKEASLIIDGSIAKAIAYVNVMKDSRHSDTIIGFDNEANDKYSDLTEDERKLYNEILNAAYSYKTVHIEAADYDGNLKEAYSDIDYALNFDSDPFIKCFLTFDRETKVDFDTFETVLLSLDSRFFDAYKDSFTLLGSEDEEKIRHDMGLLDRIVKRIIRFMPEGLTAYDRYYYLAAVLCERVTYDDRTDNCSTAFGALVDGKAVCGGYSSAYILLCKEAGLWCTARYGNAHGNAHKWNMIKLDSGIYNVDATWCDSNERSPVSRYWYEDFVKNDEVFIADGHEPIQGPLSTGTSEPNPYE